MGDLKNYGGLKKNEEKKNASRMTRELNERGAGYNLGKWTKEIGRSMQRQDAALQGLGLLYFLALQGVGAISAEDKDLVVAENLGGR